jgi:UMF1 family MFS transporter
MSPERRSLWSWALIDWANSGWAVVVMTAFFPILFQDFWGAGTGLSPEQTTAYLGYWNALSGLLVALLAPILGAVADQGNAKRRFLVGFTLLGAVATAALPLAARGEHVLAGALYALAAIGFSGNALFTDALLTDVTRPERYDRVSAFGYALGYIGGGLLFVGCTVVVQAPARFGFAGAVEAVQACFLVTAGWWLLFTIPALLWVRETPAVPAAGGGPLLTRGFRQLAVTFADLRRDRRLLTFLGAYLLYIDGVNTVIKMAVAYGRAIGLDAGGMLTALVITQFVSFPAAVVFGRLGERIGPKAGISLGIGVYAVLCIFAARMDSPREFLILAGVVGLVQGGVQSLSRSYFARLIPAERAGEYFGFYNMLGKFAAVLGPTLMAVTALATDSRASILSLLLLFGGGLWLLSRVRTDPPPSAPSS